MPIKNSKNDYLYKDFSKNSYLSEVNARISENIIKN
jgi:hypothetical protein